MALPSMVELCNGVCPQDNRTISSVLFLKHGHWTSSSLREDPMIYILDSHNWPSQVPQHIFYWKTFCWGTWLPMAMTYPLEGVSLSIRVYWLSWVMPRSTNVHVSQGILVCEECALVAYGAAGLWTHYYSFLILSTPAILVCNTKQGSWNSCSY